eukprot:369252_1
MAQRFKRIDKALGIHYSTHGINNYYNANNEGKFITFVTENEFNEDDIDLQLGNNVNPDDCLYVKMDNNFPLTTKNITHSRNEEIYKIIKYCDKHGVPPAKIDFSANLTPNDCQDTCDTKIRLLHALKYYQILNIETKNDQDKLVQFYTETYPNLLSDFCHLIIKH